MAREVAMIKPWMVCDSLTGTEEFFDTEDDALAAAEKILDEHRSDCHDAGEWTAEVEHLRVYRVAHSAQINRREKDDEGRECVDYGILPVAP
jgi:hypothetical protein